MRSILNFYRSGVIAKVLRGTVGVLGLLLVFAVSVYVAARLRQHVGQGVVTALALALAAAWAATPESRAMAVKVISALRTAGISMKEAAFLAGMDVAQLSRQLGGSEQMSLSRYAAWGQRFEQAFALQLLHGSDYTVIQNEVLVSILQELRAERKEGAAA